MVLFATIPTWAQLSTMKKIFILLFVLMTGIAQAQLIKTSLNVTVRDELGNIVAGATVKLYENEANYNSEKDPAEEGTTDEKGVVKFKNLKAIAYYVLVRKDDKDNAGKGEQTSKLEEKKINKVTIIIE